jgi:4-phytase/acid phosphatase
VRNNAAIALIAAFLGTPLAPAAERADLKYVVIVSRHGVRSPTWDAARLNRYSAQPWPDWGVAPGELTPRGRANVKLMGGYYREWLLRESLLGSDGCRDARRISIRADAEQRTRETGRAFAESLMPGCEIAVEARTDGKDPLFSGAGKPDAAVARTSVRDRLGPDARKLLADHLPALAVLQFILTGGRTAPRILTESPAETGAGMGDRPPALRGPLATASSLSEDLLLEYTNGMQGGDLGWGRLTRDNLFQVLELHKVYADLVRRTPYLARARGSNLLSHILRSLEQAASGERIPGALGQPGDVLLVLSGHDTNLSNLSGMLGLAWSLPGYQPDDTPPGGALIFSLWRDHDTGTYFVRTQYVAQSLDQLRDLEPLTEEAPPLRQDVSIPGCGVAREDQGCAWRTFRLVVEKAIDPRFTEFSSYAVCDHPGAPR